VPLVLFHMGGRNPAMFESALALARAFPNVYFNTSQTTPANLTRAVSEIGAERILFGVDWYALEPKEPLEGGQHQMQLGTVFQAKLNDRELELILGGSAAALFGLRVDPPRAD
jgi:predicted TIM-barrel fold metal-dependent hydrolase